MTTAIALSVVLMHHLERRFPANGQTETETLSCVRPQNEGQQQQISTIRVDGNGKVTKRVTAQSIVEPMRGHTLKNTREDTIKKKPQRGLHLKNTRGG